MNKLGAVAIVVGVVIAAYLLLMVAMPVLVESVSTANVTMHATSNMSAYPGVAEMTVATPWIMFFVPGTIGIIVIVVILKKP